MHALIGRLLDSALYSLPIDAVELIETHISWVLLAGDYVYKIKKPVDFGFLDFSTLARRRHFCFEELRLNRRLAADLYLDVVAITGTAEHPEFNGSGPVIEYAVKMRRFDEAALFDRMLAENRLEAPHIDQLSDTIAAFHAAIERSNSSDAHGLSDDIQAAALENFAHIDPQLITSSEAASLHALSDWTETNYANLQALMHERKAHGFVRECHGDLHLGNIVCIDKHAVPFDCIEFNDKLRWIDVISEVAFCMMDLQAKNRSDLAYRFLNRYLAITGDYAGCRLLRYYLVYRGIVRAKIAILSLAQTDVVQQRTALQAHFQRQLRFALSCSRPDRPFLLLCHGFSGSGKSTLAAKLAERLPAIQLRSDIERKRLSGIGAAAESGSQLRQGIYTPDMTERTYHYLAERSEELLRTSFSVIVDATFLHHWQRNLFYRTALNCSAQFVILDIQAAETTLRQRIEQRLHERQDPSEADTAVLEQQLLHHEPLTPQERQIRLTINGEISITDKLADDIIVRLNAFI